MFRSQTLSVAFAVLVFSICGIGWGALQDATLSLAQEGKTAYTIVLADDAAGPEKTAAAQLQKYLQQVSGADFFIRTEAQVTPLTSQILIGPGGRAKSLLPDQDWAALGTDGIVIQAVGRNLILAGGRPRGTLYAVFQFLQEDIGCRWWTPTESDIPHRPTLNVTVRNVSYRPPFDYREDYTTAPQVDPIFATILRENGSNQRQTAEWGGHYTLLGFVHTMGRLLPPGKYFKAHPQWYTDPANHDLPCTAASKIPEEFQLDLSNPEVVDELTLQALQWIKKNPSAGYISISQNDNNHYCRCPQCTKLAHDEGSQAAPVLKFVNAVAERIHKQYPDFEIETLAYRYTIKPPRTLRPAKNVLIRVAPIGADFGHPMDSDWNKADRDDFLAWSKIAPQLFIWNYTTNFHFTMLPHPNWAGLAADLRFYAAHHVTGVFQESDAFTNDVGDFVQLRTWLIGHLLWNPNLDQGKLTNEFLNGYYGAAGPFLRQYLDLVEQSYLKQNRPLSTYNSDFSFFLLDVANQAVHLFQQAADAVKNDSVLSARLRRERLSLDALLLHRFKFFHAEAQRTGQAFAGPASAKEAVIEFEKTARKYHVRNFSESMPFDVGASKLAAALRVSTVPLPDFAKKYSAADVIDLQPATFSLYRNGTITQIVHDPAASGQKAARMSGDTVQWAIQAPLGSSLTAAAQRWHVYVIARAEVTAGAALNGSAFQGGIYDTSNRNAAAEFTFPMTEAAGATYHRFDLGTHTLTSGMYFWFAPFNIRAVKNIYIDRVLLIREKAADTPR